MTTPTRLTQLLSRYVGMAMLAVVAWVLGSEPDPDTAERVLGLAQSIVVAAIGFGGIVVDLLIHRLKTGGVLKPPGRD